MAFRNLPRPRPGGKSQRKKSCRIDPGSSLRDVKRVLTYDNTTIHDKSSESHCYPSGSARVKRETGCDSVDHIKELLDITGTQGIAIVQRQNNHKNTSLDNAGAARRPNPKSSVRMKSLTRKFRAALPGYGPTPCCPSY